MLLLRFAYSKATLARCNLYLWLLLVKRHSRISNKVSPVFNEWPQLAATYTSLWNINCWLFTVRSLVKIKKTNFRLIFFPQILNFLQTVARLLVLSPASFATGRFYSCLIIKPCKSRSHLSNCIAACFFSGLYFTSLSHRSTFILFSSSFVYVVCCGCV